MDKKQYLWTLLVVLFTSLFLFIGLTHFNTRGEPREAVVAMTMLEQHNWILPTNNGVELAFKPPFFHWCVALTSTIVGVVNEYTARFPSALALFLMTLTGYLFYAKRRGKEVAFIASILLITTFEVHRAGVACRVDMVLTAAMVIALYRLYVWVEHRMSGLPWVAMLCLSAAALTKGPVGLLLPLVVPTVFLLFRGENLWRVCYKMFFVAVGASVLPLCWYYAAWQQGGDRFLQLVMEENVYRLLGKMSYDSHVNPAYYNVQTVLLGFLPYTLLVLFSLFALNYKRVDFEHGSRWACLGGRRWTDLKGHGRALVHYLRHMDDARLYSLLAAVIIFVFYCIPKSKRSVYLLPVYPFLAFFLAEYIIFLRHRHVKVIKAFGVFMVILCVLLTSTFVLIKLGVLQADVVNFGNHAIENIAYFNALKAIPLNVMNVVLVLIPLVIAVRYIRYHKLMAADNHIIYSIMFMVYGIFLALDGVYQPAILNVKSDKKVAQEIARIVPEGPIYTWRPDVTEGNRMHPFTVNFYLNDRCAPIECFNPKQGYVFMGQESEADFRSVMGGQYDIELVYESHHRSCDDKRHNNLYRFERVQR